MKCLKKNNKKNAELNEIEELILSLSEGCILTISGAIIY